MSVEYSVISIGTLSHNMLWNEPRAVRTTHATTTLVTDGDRRILIDPSLPGKVLETRLFERTGHGIDSITDVFCTTLRPDSRRALNETLGEANWWASQRELEWYTRQLEDLRESAERLENLDVENVEKELAVVRKFRPALEKFSSQVSIYPLYGPTPGCCGLLLTPPTATIVIAGPTAATAEHIERGMIWKECTDKEPAMESLRDLLELADVIVPGFDNVYFSSRNWL